MSNYNRKQSRCRYKNENGNSTDNCSTIHIHPLKHVVLYGAEEWCAVDVFPCLYLIKIGFYLSNFGSQFEKRTPDTPPPAIDSDDETDNIYDVRIQFSVTLIISLKKIRNQRVAANSSRALWQLN